MRERYNASCVLYIFFGALVTYQRRVCVSASVCVLICLSVYLSAKLSTYYISFSVGLCVSLVCLFGCVSGECGKALNEWMNE